jgi:hypothetical protein
MAFMETLQNIGQGAKDFLVGTPGRVDQIPLLNPQQQALQSQIGSAASGMLGNIGNNKFDFAPIAQQARTNFQTQTLPSIAARFSGMGNQRGSDYRYALGSAGAGLDEGLAALQQKYNLAQGSQQQQLLLALLSQALQPQQQNIFGGPQNGLLQSLFPAVSGGVNAGLMSILKLLGLG